MAGCAAPADPGTAGYGAPTTALADCIDAALPQTQCRRCGYDDCRAYAVAMAHDAAPVNRCPPGGAAGIGRLAALTGRSPLPLDPDTGAEGPLRLARIDEAWCIGCTLCLAACPVDCIVGAPKRMHSVVAAQCTGCALCLPACPVDCIEMVDAPAAAEPAPTGWAAWSAERAAEARDRYAFHRRRFAGAGADDTASPSPPTGPAATPAPSGTDAALRSRVAAAVARARRSNAA